MNSIRFESSVSRVGITTNGETVYSLQAWIPNQYKLKQELSLPQLPAEVVEVSRSQVMQSELLGIKVLRQDFVLKSNQEGVHLLPPPEIRLESASGEITVTAQPIMIAALSAKERHLSDISSLLPMEDIPESVEGRFDFSLVLISLICTLGLVWYYKKRTIQQPKADPKQTVLDMLRTLETDLASRGASDKEFWVIWTQALRLWLDASSLHNAQTLSSEELSLAILSFDGAQIGLREKLSQQLIQAELVKFGGEYTSVAEGSEAIYCLRELVFYRSEAKQ